MIQFKKLFTLVLLGFVFISISACHKNEDSTPLPSNGNPRNISYQITGNFTGTIFVSYTTASGGTVNENVTLPWSKEIDYSNSLAAAVIAITGNGGVAGQMATVVVKQGGKQKSETVATATGTTGSFSKSSPIITF